MPAVDAWPLLLGDPAPPGPVFQVLQPLAGVIALVRNQLGRLLPRRRGIDGGQIGFGGLERVRQGRGVALVGGWISAATMAPVRGRPRARACRPAGCGHPSAWRSWPRGRSARPSPRWTAACPCAGGPGGSGPPPLASRCRLPWPDAAASRDSHRRCRGGDAAQRGVGRHGRGIDADPVALEQPVLDQALQHPRKVNTASCTSSGRRERVRLSHEWSGAGSVVPSRRNSRKDRLSAQRHSRPRSLSIPSK